MRKPKDALRLKFEGQQSHQQIAMNEASLERHLLPAPRTMFQGANSPIKLCENAETDYAELADRPDSQTVIAQLPKWFENYNYYHPHSATCPPSCSGQNKR